jgi:hypothetical protein
VDKIPGRRLVQKAEEAGNQVEVPMARSLGMVELLKRLAKEVQEDHLAAFAGNLTYKGLFALFPFFIFCSPCSGSSERRGWSRARSTGSVLRCRKGR